jgi:phosphatidylinositol alpha-mannosyltransferase
VKVGIVSQSYYPRPGGVTEVVHYTAKILRERGHDVTIITTRYSGDARDEKGVIRIGRNVLVPMNGAWVNMTVGVGLRDRLRGIFEREAFDVVHTHCPLVPTLPLLTFSAVSPGQKLVGTFHAAAEKNLPYQLLNRPLSRRIERLDCRMAVSEAARAFINKYFPGRYEIVPNGIDCGRFHPGVQPIERFMDGTLNILFVGRMDRRKGVPYLMRALPALRRRYRGRIRLILVGERGLRTLLLPRPLDLGGVELVFVGRVSPEMLPRYYATADVFCSPAIGQESFGIVLLEAMASGKPIVASDIPGYRTVATSGDEAILVPPRNPERIADALLALAENPRLRAELGSRGRRTALRYNWPAVVDTLEAIYSRVVGDEIAGVSETVVQARR